MEQLPLDFELPFPKRTRPEKYDWNKIFEMAAPHPETPTVQRYVKLTEAEDYPTASTTSMVSMVYNAAKRHGHKVSCYVDQDMAAFVVVTIPPLPATEEGAADA